MNLEDTITTNSIKKIVDASLSDMIATMETHSFTEDELMTPVGAVFSALLTIASELNRSARILAEEADLSHPELQAILVEAASMIGIIRQFSAANSPRHLH